MSTTISKLFYTVDTTQVLLALRALIAQGHMEATPMIVGAIETHTSIMWVLKANRLLKEGHHKVMHLMLMKANNHMPRRLIPTIMKKAMVTIMMNIFLRKNMCANDNSMPKLKPVKNKSTSMNKSAKDKQTWGKHTMRGK